MKTQPLSRQMDWRNVPGRGDVPRPYEDQDSAVDEIVDAIWDDDALLADAVRKADRMTPIATAVGQHAVRLYRAGQTEDPA